MGGVILFGVGLLVGVVYEKSIRAWKRKAERAVKAAHEALAD